MTTILIILVAAKVAAELAERLRVPAVAAEILAGVLIGPSVLHLVKENEITHVLGELGVILLLLDVGMHMDLGELRSVGRRAMSVAVVGVALPFVTGYAACLALGLSTDAAVFTGAALTATSVGITARVFGDLQALGMRESRTVLGAAVADDVIGLIVLTVVVRVVTGNGSVSVLSVSGVVIAAVAFLVVCTWFGLRLVPRALTVIEKHAKSGATLFVLALAIVLGFAELATVAKLAPIIGAFVAGLALAKSSASSKLQREFVPIGHLFIPVFFLQIGINVDVSVFANRTVLATAALLTVVAVIGKVLAGFGGGGSVGSRLLIGVGMIPRGEVGLIFAAIGLREGVLDQDLYGALLLTVLVTTLVTPPVLGVLIPRLRKVDLDPADGPSWDLSDVRRAEAIAFLGDTDRSEHDDVVDRISYAPLPYVLSNTASDIARHAQLVNEARENDTFAVSVNYRNGQVLIAIASRDRLGLLAHTTNALLQLKVEVLDATITTWGDGLALQVFSVAASTDVSVNELEDLLDAPFPLREGGKSVHTIADASILFDNHSSPWRTIAELHATDRHGLLHNVAVLFAEIGVDVHAARISTHDEMVRDVFELSTRAGEKLSDRTQSEIRAALLVVTTKNESTAVNVSTVA